MSLWLVALIATSLRGVGIERLTVDFDYVKAQAQELAAKDYEPPKPPRLPRKLRNLNYNSYREIEFRAETALWSGAENLPFQLQFFHRGGIFEQRVEIHECSPTHSQEIPFRKEFFNYRALGDVGRVRSDVGYAGFRVHYALNRPDAMDELVSFLGASYFRAVGTGQSYGLSARGLAINSALPGLPEEFPAFTTFWIHKPTPDATQLRWYALLDSPSVAGAYAFTIEPERETTMTVEVALYWRQAVAEPGWAPLTSMFWFGENSTRPPNSLRDEVHDSDGWWIETGDAGRIWQPLRSENTPRVSEVATTQLKRFGLLQRDRRFDSYQDLEANYHRRPSAWIEPIGDWGPGRVRLCELPTNDEFQDNIVAYWRPDRPAAAGETSEYAYRLVWGNSPAPAEPQLARPVATRRGVDLEGRQTWWIDFAGAEIEQLDPAQFGVEVKPGPGLQVVHQDLARLPDAAGWRVIIVTQAAPDQDAPSDPALSCTLRKGPDAISETWSISNRP